MKHTFIKQLHFIKKDGKPKTSSVRVYEHNRLNNENNKEKRQILPTTALFEREIDDNFLYVTEQFETHHVNNGDNVAERNAHDVFASSNQAFPYTTVRILFDTDSKQERTIYATRESFDNVKHTFEQLTPNDVMNLCQIMLDLDLAYELEQIKDDATYVVSLEVQRLNPTQIKPLHKQRQHVVSLM